MTSLQQAREDKNLTVEELAEASRVEVDTITAIEAGDERPSFSTALKIAGALEIDVKEIVELSSVFGSPFGSSVEPLLGPRVGP